MAKIIKPGVPPQKDEAKPYEKQITCEKCGAVFIVYEEDLRERPVKERSATRHEFWADCPTEGCDGEWELFHRTY